MISVIKVHYWSFSQFICLFRFTLWTTQEISLDGSWPSCPPVERYRVGSDCLESMWLRVPLDGVNVISVATLCLSNMGRASPWQDRHNQSPDAAILCWVLPASPPREMTAGVGFSAHSACLVAWPSTDQTRGDFLTVAMFKVSLALFHFPGHFPFTYFRLRFI